jgi:hypothetical protein
LDGENNHTRNLEHNWRVKTNTIKTIIKKTNLDTILFESINDAGVLGDAFELTVDCFNELKGPLIYLSVNEGCDILIIIT